MPLSLMSPPSRSGNAPQAFSLVSVFRFFMWVRGSSSDYQKMIHENTRITRKRRTPINKPKSKERNMRLLNGKQRERFLSLALRLLIIACCSIALLTPPVSSAGFHPKEYPAQSTLTAQAKPLPPSARWLGLIGEYGPDDDILIILEKDGKLCASFKRAEPEPLDEITRNDFKFPALGPHALQQLIFERNRNGRATQVAVDAVILKRRQIEPESGNQLRVKPLRQVPELMKSARAAQPPAESGDFRETDLVELTNLDPTIKLEIRYATTNNFLGTRFYSAARAFMQRPAAEAVVRANRKLRALGYGLLVHDAYRPWYVTKVFWDATPDDKKVFVADPAKGSRHNRGCAVDLTLYDLKTMRPIEMVSTYDETTARAYPDYPGGTSFQRWHRNLLRDAMDAEGFTVYEAEWWHFDYQDWRKYRIGNVTFEQIGAGVR
jgi:D-alanyl-D-alanine dipeptidase